MMNASDHNLIYVVREQPKQDKTFKYIWVRSYRRFDPLLFERDILFENWEDVIQELDANLTWTLFAKKLTYILDIHTPYK